MVSAEIKQDVAGYTYTVQERSCRKEIENYHLYCVYLFNQLKGKLSLHFFQCSAPLGTKYMQYLPHVLMCFASLAMRSGRVPPPSVPIQQRSQQGDCCLITGACLGSKYGTCPRLVQECRTKEEVCVSLQSPYHVIQGITWSQASILAAMSLLAMLSGSHGGSGAPYPNSQLSLQSMQEYGSKQPFSDQSPMYLFICPLGTDH